ncbi:MAG: M16 family metallopeptidase [Myxococcales bacterium]
MRTSPATTSLAAALLLAAVVGCSHEQPKPAASSSSAAPAPARTADKAPAQTSTPPAAAPTTTQSGPPLYAAQETPDAPFRAEKPPPLQGKMRFDAPVPVERKLRNGARVLVTELRAVPIVAIDVLFATGVNGEPPGKAGLAGFVASMVTEGTRSRTTTQLAAELDEQAIELGGGAGNETSRVRVNALKESLPKAVELLADVLQNPAFRPGDVDRVRKLKLAGLAQKQGNPGALAADESSKLLYGERHPWGQPSGGTPETVESITADDLRRYREDWYRPNNALISVAGDVTADEIVRLLDERLTGWKQARLRKLVLPAFPPSSRRFVDAVDKPGTTQSQVWVGGRLFEARHPDRLPMLVANEVLGGLFTSRLNMNLREQHGYSYGVFSHVQLSRSYGAFLATGGILAQHTAEAVREYEKELERFAAEGPTDPEVAKAKETLIRGLPAALETNDAVAAALATIVFNGLPLDHYRTVAARIEKITRADAARVAKKWIRPGQWPVVVVGPVSGAADALEALALGEVRLHHAPGELEVRAPAPQRPADAKGPTAGTVRADEPQTGAPPATAPQPPQQDTPAPAAQPSAPSPAGPAGQPGAPPAAPPAQSQPPAGAQQPPPSARP